MKNTFEASHTPSQYENERQIFLAIEETIQTVSDMVESQQAYVQEKKDQEGNLEWIKVFANDGTLLYFEDNQAIEKNKQSARNRESKEMGH